MMHPLKLFISKEGELKVKKLRILAAIILSIMFMLFATGCAVKEPVPEITEGRFDFSVTYEIDGLEKTYSGVYICNYDGISVTFVGRRRMWDGYIDGTNSWGLIAIHETNDDSIIYIDFGFDPEYFMSDPDYIEEIPKPNLFVEHINEEIGETTWLNDEEEIFEKYGVKLISYDYAAPIKNSFESKWSFGHFEPEIN